MRRAACLWFKSHRPVTTALACQASSITPTRTAVAPLPCLFPWQVGDARLATSDHRPCSSTAQRSGPTGRLAGPGGLIASACPSVLDSADPRFSPMSWTNRSPCPSWESWASNVRWEDPRLHCLAQL
ncbi:uncharacterized protein B0H18DRAFT_210595 [Fomitopsis serialis]|uniref:uncharacterized protein n=1 Tax=Fomitopsis serialis TaxID=139415 RepID=UPI002007FDAD|nr:uncharacterized protein B0H18DRAFT_210595 [Neoantrodia serialis]KAH9929418.1 hypothetical protein B0H18DRAFT_210595 [Neoantrodia serialis]